MLNEYGSLIWVEPPNVFISNNIEKYLDKSKSSGLLAWPMEEPVSQLTHPLMFDYFNAKVHDFYFVHMLDTSQLIIYNNWKIHTELMLPWVKCALKEDCISPVGSQFSGCDFNRLPAFLFSGCHRYEMSAFSIITAQLFNFDLNKYTMQLEDSDLDLDFLQEKLSAATAAESNKNQQQQQLIRIKTTKEIEAKDVEKSLEDDKVSLNRLAGSFIQKYYQNSFMTPISLLSKTANNLLSINKNQNQNNNDLFMDMNARKSNLNDLNRYKRKRYNNQYQQAKSKQ